jgi:hypothetical protein
MAGVLRYVRPERFRLKDAPEFSERWLQDLIVNDPSVLGLGGATCDEPARVSLAQR